MDRPPPHIGFSDHVMNFGPAGNVPEFPAAPPGYGHVTHGPENAFLNAPPDYSGSAPHGGFGSTPYSGFGSARHGGFGSAPFDSSWTHTAGAAPYGFVTNNWLEERQSWFPRPPTPPPRSEDTNEAPPPHSEDTIETPPPRSEDTDEALPPRSEDTNEAPPPRSEDTDKAPPPRSEDTDEGPPITGGFRIGFESFDSPVHHHHIASRAEPASVPSGWPQLRSPTLGATSWPDISEARRRLLQDALQPHGYGPPPSHLTTPDWRVGLQEAPWRRDPEAAAFCEAVMHIRRGYCAADRGSNPGRIWSPAVPFPDDITDTEVEINIYREELQPTLCTVQRDSVRVEDLISDVLRQIVELAPPVPPPSAPLYPRLHGSHSAPPLYPSLLPPGKEAEPVASVFYLSICGLDAYLQPGLTLRSHAALQRQRRIHLGLHVGEDPRYPLARTTEDDRMELRLGDRLDHAPYWQELKKRVFVAVSDYEDQVRYFLHNQSAGIHRVLEAVKEICYLLRSVETPEISGAARTLSTTNWAQPRQMAGPVQLPLVALSRGISELLSIYSRSFHTNFMAETPRVTPPLEAGPPILTFHLRAAHNLPQKWATSDGVFYVSSSLIYAGRKICPEVKSKNAPASKSFFFRVLWEEMIRLPVPVSALPYESLLVLRLYAETPATPRGSFIAWSGVPLYSDRQMVQGALLLNMISHAEPPAAITPAALDPALPTLMTVQVDFPDHRHAFQPPAPADAPHDMSAENAAQLLQCLAHRSSVLLLSEEDKRRLWSGRRCPQKPPNILPLILGSAPGWDPPTVAAMHRLVDSWGFSGPLEALGLLSPSVADGVIRTAAGRQLQHLSCDEVLMFLPQLVQAVKFEWSADSVVVRLLLQRSLESIQVAHRLYWLLADAAAAEPHYRGLYQRLLQAVESSVGRAVGDQLSREKRLLAILGEAAERVKNAPEDRRQEALKSELQHIQQFFQEVGECRLPLNPAVRVRGILQDSCSFYNSNAKPLKISFVNADPRGPNIHIMYKVGDDLRQDALVLQVVELMDRIWLHEGLDLQMITYSCVPTGPKRGLVELVPDSTTLAKIQKSSGLLGPLRDSSMKKWFHSNRTASDNFLFSCAGWCVVTFLLGVCDRHNDNILLTGAGVLFHIDFGKILGNAQMFGSIKRDRAPFIFTPEMESFITEEGRSPRRAEQFADLCCCAYNVIRRHSCLLMTVLEMMLQAGLPELRTVGDLKYVHDRLRPYDSDAEAASYFTSKIKESLESPSVRLNFLIHAFASMTPSDLSRMSETATASLTKLLRRAAAKSVRKVQRAGGRILGALGDPAGSGDLAQCVELRLSFSAPRLRVLLRRLRNVSMPDGSAPPAVSSTISLYYGTREVASQEIRSQSPTAFHQRVEFAVPRLDGHSLGVLVTSGGAFLGRLSLPLRGVPLEEDVSYRLHA